MDEESLPLFQQLTRGDPPDGDAEHPLSFRDVEDLLAERGIEVSAETVRRRERKQQRFKSPGSAQRFQSIHSAIYNAFYVQRHLLTRHFFKQYRAEAFSVWNQSWRAALTG